MRTAMHTGRLRGTSVWNTVDRGVQPATCGAHTDGGRLPGGSTARDLPRACKKRGGGHVARGEQDTGKPVSGHLGGLPDGHGHEHTHLWAVNPLQHRSPGALGWGLHWAPGLCAAHGEVRVSPLGTWLGASGRRELSGSPGRGRQESPWEAPALAPGPTVGNSCKAALHPERGRPKVPPDTKSAAPTPWILVGLGS